LRILFVTPYVPSAVRIRPLAFIRELARLGHQVTLACLVQPAWETKYLEDVRPYCLELHPVSMSRSESLLRTFASLPTRTPLSVAYCHSTEFGKVVQDLHRSNGFDLIHTEFVRAAPVTLELNGIRKVFDAVDSIALANRRSIGAPHVSLKQRVVSYVEWFKLHRYEPWITRQYDRVLVSSPADKKVLEHAGQPVDVIPNGVDSKYFEYYSGPRKLANIVFLGKMSYYVNVASVLWFYRQVFPKLQVRHPDVKFIIVGREPSKAVRALEANPAVEVTGTVADVRPYLEQAALAICPMVSGSGIQNKMLEAMSVGTPCVATSLAVQALGVTSKEVKIADRAEDFAEAVLDLFEQPELRRKMSEYGRCYVEQFHGWERIGQRLDRVYSETIQYK
jgi:polysaccharide biosynthesis protein PslH